MHMLFCSFPYEKLIPQVKSRSPLRSQYPSNIANIYPADSMATSSVQITTEQ